MCTRVLILVGGAARWRAISIHRGANAHEAGEQPTTPQVAVVAQRRGSPARRRSGRDADDAADAAAASVRRRGRCRESAGIDAPDALGSAARPAGSARRRGLAERSASAAAARRKRSEIDPEHGRGSRSASKGIGRAGRGRGRRRAARPAKSAEKREAPSRRRRQLATTVHEAVQLIKDGKQELALASLRALQKKQPQQRATSRSSWGTSTSTSSGGRVAMDHYQAAIKKNAGYRSNPMLNKNVIRMLASAKTRQQGYEFPARRDRPVRPVPISSTPPHTTRTRSSGSRRRTVGPLHPLSRGLGVRRLDRRGADP